ncbi:MAG: hypothetical protein FJ403_16100 [Verrucomicrobia bacterium]|nr:hypothetical protein [Verrucomicrobiota bacterium]
MPAEGIIQTLQRAATAPHPLDVLTVDARDFQNSTTSRIEKVEGQIADLRERLAKLEASRAADRAEMQADLSRFKLEVERAELSLTRSLPSSSSKPSKKAD